MYVRVSVFMWGCEYFLLMWVCVWLAYCLWLIQRFRWLLIFHDFRSQKLSHTHNTPIPTHSHLHMFTRYSPYICRLLFLIFKWLFFFYFLLIHFLWVVLFALYFRFFIFFSFLFLVLYVFFVSENPCVALVVVVSLNRYYYICICTCTFYIYIHISSQYERTVTQSSKQYVTFLWKS